MIIERSKISECIRLINLFPAIGIVGPRQVGKTFLVKQISNQLPKDNIYLDLELESDLNKVKDPQFFLQQNVDKTVIIDEIQRFPNLYPLLRALIDQKREPARFILLGSASPELIRDVSESLAGRIAYLEISPISLVETPEVISQNDLWLRGGFPLSLLADTEENGFEWMRFFVRSYIERDLPLLGLQVSPVQIGRLWRMLAHLNGQLLNFTDLSNSLGISVNTAKRYVDFMEEAYLIRRIYPLWANLKKRIVKTSKIFIRDTGILHYLLNINSFNNLMANPAAGHSWESFVVEQIAANLPSGIEMYHYRTHNGSETDLVLNRSLSTIASIEIKLSDSPSLGRGNTIAFTDLDAPMNYVITPSSDDYLFRERIRICSLKTFVYSYLPGL